MEIVRKNFAQPVILPGADAPWSRLVILEDGSKLVLRPVPYEPQSGYSWDATNIGMVLQYLPSNGTLITMINLPFELINTLVFESFWRQAGNVKELVLHKQYDPSAEPGAEVTSRLYIPIAQHGATVHVLSRETMASLPGRNWHLGFGQMLVDLAALPTDDVLVENRLVDGVSCTHEEIVVIRDGSPSRSKIHPLATAYTTAHLIRRPSMA